MTLRSDCVANYETYFLLSNEDGLDNVCEVLEKKRERETPSYVPCYAGVSAFQNYSMIAASQPELVVLFDYNRAQCELHELTQREILLAKNVDEFAQNFVRSFKKSRFYIQLLTDNAPDDPESTQKLIDSQLEKIKEKEIDWLQNPQRFERIQWLFANHRVAIKNLNIASPDFCDFLKRTFEEMHRSARYRAAYTHGPLIDTLYISNAPFWLTEYWERSYNDPSLFQFQRNIAQIYQSNPQLHFAYSTSLLFANVFQGVGDYERYIRSRLMYTPDTFPRHSISTRLRLQTMDYFNSLEHPAAKTHEEKKSAFTYYLESFQTDMMMEIAKALSDEEIYECLENIIDKHTALHENYLVVLKKLISMRLLQPPTDEKLNQLDRFLAKLYQRQRAFCIDLKTDLPLCYRTRELYTT